MTKSFRATVYRGAMILAYIIIASMSASSDTIVVLGSSTAAGSGPLDTNNSWVRRYSRYAKSLHPDIEIVNLAVGGFTTCSILPTGITPPFDSCTPNATKNISRATQYNPSAIIINLPTNDAAKYYSVERQLTNYDSVLSFAGHYYTALSKKGTLDIPVWITTPQPRNFTESTRLALLLEMRDSTYSRFGDHSINFWTGLANEDGTMRDEFRQVFLDSAGNVDHYGGVHLNDTAHGILFERVVAAGILEKTSFSFDRFSEKYSSQYSQSGIVVRSIKDHFVISGIATEGKLIILNLNGRIVNTFNALSNETRFSIPSLRPEQVYIFRFQTGEKTITGKIVRTKE